VLLRACLQVLLLLRGLSVSALPPLLLLPLLLLLSPSQLLLLLLPLLLLSLPPSCVDLGGKSATPAKKQRRMWQPQQAQVSFCEQQVAVAASFFCGDLNRKSATRAREADAAEIQAGA
jgi:hypothetical protein